MNTLHIRMQPYLLPKYWLFPQIPIHSKNENNILFLVNMYPLVNAKAYTDNLKETLAAVTEQSAPYFEKYVKDRVMDALGFYGSAVTPQLIIQFNAAQYPQGM